VLLRPPSKIQSSFLHLLLLQCTVYLLAVSGHHAMTFILLCQFLIFFTTQAKSNQPSFPLRSTDCLYEGTSSAWAAKRTRRFPQGLGGGDATLPGHTRPANSGCQLTEREEGQLHDGKACQKLNNDLLELAKVAKSRT
jgi:hypothetical protein